MVHITRTMIEDHVMADELVEVPIPSSDEENHQTRMISRELNQEQKQIEDNEDEGGETEDDNNEEDDEENNDGTVKKKKDKKLVFLSRSVLEKIKERPMTTGTQIANEILELYKRFSAVIIFLPF